MMNLYWPFWNYFKARMDAPCPKTDALIKAGFQKPGSGYIDYAKSLGLEVDYRKALPNQGWHMVKSYLERTEPDKARIASVSCGELWFWAAEVSGALSEKELDGLAEEVLALDCRRKANTLIRKRCLPGIIEIVMNEYKTA